MRKGLILSVLFHGGLLLAAVFSLVHAKTFKPPVIQSIPLDIVDISELTKVKAGLKKVPEKKVTKTPEPKKPIAKINEPKKKKKPAPKRKVEAAPEPVPEPKPEIIKKVEEKVKKKPEPKKVAEKPKPKPKPKAKPKPKPKKITKKKPSKKKKKKSYEDKIAALLNKVPDAGASSTKLPDLPGAKKVKGDPSGRDLVMSINELDLFRRQVSQCWNPPVGGLGAEDLKVKLRIELRKDGTLKNQPRLLNRNSSPFFRAAADSAMRAIWQCQPYNQLPIKKYKTWRDMIINFDPRQMLQG